MRDEITVLKVEPGKPPEIVSMANSLRAMQEMVGGYIIETRYGLRPGGQVRTGG